MSKGPSLSRWVVGQHSCHEAVRVHPKWVTELLIMEGRENDHHRLIELAQHKKIKMKSKGKKFFSSLAEGHQGVAVAMSDRVRWKDESAQKDQSLVVFLDGITDPHNLGAILRTSWLMEVDGIFIPKNRRVDLTPVVCKVASGGAEHVPVESCHFQSQLKWFKDNDYWVYALSEKGNVLLPHLNPAKKTVLVLGAEGKGLRSSTENFCDQFVRIPQVSSGSSYNASVAFGLCAYEYTRNCNLKS